MYGSCLWLCSCCHALLHYSIPDREQRLGWSRELIQKYSSQVLYHLLDRALLGDHVQRSCYRCSGGELRWVLGEDKQYLQRVPQPNVILV